jgi:hypothetical protein
MYLPEGPEILSSGAIDDFDQLKSRTNCRLPMNIVINRGRFLFPAGNGTLVPEPAEGGVKKNLESHFVYLPLVMAGIVGALLAGWPAPDG